MNEGFVIMRGSDFENPPGLRAAAIVAAVVVAVVVAVGLWAWFAAGQ